MIDSKKIIVLRCSWTKFSKDNMRNLFVQYTYSRTKSLCHRQSL
jgi:hypothetical protein